MIYLDHHATTPCDPRVVEAMLPFFTQHFGNASSTHEAGREAADAVEAARSQVAQLLGARPNEIVFTSGATESNNLAILGLARAFGDKRSRIVTMPIEHKAVLGPCRELEKEGFDLVVLPVDRAGSVDLAAAAQAINQSTLLVSIQAANHEIGTIQPVREITALSHAQGAFVHCDAAQAAGKILLNVNEWGVDLLSLSAHKMYGPKGIGALYVRNGQRLGLSPLVFGGGQESDLRPGTLNVPAIIGLGEASRLCCGVMDVEAARLSQLRDNFEAQLLAAIPDLRRNGNLQNRLPHNSSLTFPGIEADALLANLPSLALSTGSACTSGALEPSQVLSAIGLPRDEAYATVRIGLGRGTTGKEVEVAAKKIVAAFERLRDLNGS
jgi:cysteine desulfurase